MKKNKIAVKDLKARKTAKGGAESYHSSVSDFAFKTAPAGKGKDFGLSHRPEKAARVRIVDGTLSTID